MKSLPYRLTFLMQESELDNLIEGFNNDLSCVFEFLNIYDNPEERFVEISDFVILMFIEPDVANKLISNLKKFKKTIKLENISWDIFNNEINTSVFHENIKNQVENHIIEKYEVNDVLDKVMEKSIDCLTPMDKVILESKKAR